MRQMSMSSLLKKFWTKTYLLFQVYVLSFPFLFVPSDGPGSIMYEQ